MRFYYNPFMENERGSKGRYLDVVYTSRVGYKQVRRNGGLEMNKKRLAKSTDEFLKMFGEVVDNATPFLEKGRYFALVIGDKYSKGEWIPLGFYCMQEVLKRRYLLKSIIVKNFEETRGKRNQKNCGG